MAARKALKVAMVAEYAEDLEPLESPETQVPGAISNVPVEQVQPVAADANVVPDGQVRHVFAPEAL